MSDRLVSKTTSLEKATFNYDSMAAVVRDGKIVVSSGQEMILLSIDDFRAFVLDFTEYESAKTNAQSRVI